MLKSSETHLAMLFLGNRKNQYQTLVLIRLEQIRVINILNNPIIFTAVLTKNQKNISASIFPTSYILRKVNFMGVVTVHINAHARGGVSGPLKGTETLCKVLKQS